MDYPTIFLLILAFSFSLAALLLTRHKCRITGQNYLKSFYFKLWINLAYTATLLGFTLTGADLNLSSDRLAYQISLALLSLLGMTLIYADSYFHAQACLKLVECSFSRPYRLFLFVLLLASLVLIVFLFTLTEAQKRKDYLDLLFYLAVFVNFSCTVGSSLLMITLSKTWKKRRRKAVLCAGSLFIFVVASYILIVVLGQLGWISRSLFLAQMLAKAIVFNAFVLVYLNAFLVAVGDEGLPASGVLVGEGFVKLYAISKREQEIIRLICEGESNDEIGRHLFISLPTVKGHVYNVFQKTGVKNRVQLVNLIKVSTLPEAKGDRNCPGSRTQPR